jgi:hypothetical protein
MDVDLTWDRVSDLVEDSKKNCDVYIAIYFDVSSNKDIAISNIAPFARREVHKVISRLPKDITNPIVIQLYCSLKTVKMRVNKIPYSISELEGEYSFTITLSPDMKISLKRRYITTQKL